MGVICKGEGEKFRVLLVRNQINRRIGLIHYIVRHSGWKEL